MAMTASGLNMRISNHFISSAGNWRRALTNTALHGRVSLPVSTMKRRAMIFYAETGIDRATQFRSDPKWISDALKNPKTLVVPIQANKCIVKLDKAVLVPPSKLSISLSNDDECNPVFLGLTSTDRQPLFTVDVKVLSSADDDWEKEGQWVDIRRYGSELEAYDAGLLAYARGMLEWHSRNGFCGLCGKKMSSSLAGHSLKCLSSSCQNAIYPRLDPAIIVLVACGNYVLLGRQERWTEGRYSLLAGFVEVGETFEEGVVREVKEESDIDVEDSSIQYAGSQPWPFPSSLMVGFVAEARKKNTSGKEFSENEKLAGVDEFECLPKTVPDVSELEDARWVHKDFLRDVIEDKLPQHSDSKFNIPGKNAIAHLLMERWIQSKQENDPYSLPVRTAVIDEGTFKYVLIHLKDDKGNQKLVVRGNKALPYHTNIVEALKDEVKHMNLEVEAMGGGKIRHCAEIKEITVYGMSQAYGQANHRLTANLLRQSFPLHSVAVSSDDF